MELRKDELVAVEDVETEAKCVDTTELLSLRLATVGCSGLAEVTLV